MALDDSYAEYNEDFNKKYPKFKLGDHVRISKYKKIFAKEYAPNWSEEVFFCLLYIFRFYNNTKIQNTFVKNVNTFHKKFI